MSRRLTPTELIGVRELTASLETLMPGAPSALEQVASELPLLLRAQRSLAFSLKRDGAGLLDWDALYHRGMPPRALDDALEVIRARPLDAFLFDPFLPDIWQRDRALTLADLGDPERAAIHGVYGRHGLSGEDQVRALICEGPTLLAWVGAFRPEPFTAVEKQLLGQLVPPLKRRLKLDRLLNTTALRESALAVVLEAIPSPAFVVSGLLHVEQANAAGRTLLERDRMTVLEALRQSASAPGVRGSYALTRLEIHGMPGHYLAVRRAAPADPAPRLVVAQARWRLSPKQSKVLSLLSLGHSNRALATLLCCAEGTIEQHIKALFAKSGAESRAELVATFWSQLVP